jgi:autonomous glycyl radical cofactor GrcA
MTSQVRAIIGAVALLLAPVAAGAQMLSYNSGQNVAPAYEGWEEDPDGTKYFLFGYMNRNWEEELDVPIGPANGFAPGPADQGQPTHFLPRRNRFVFRIKVPANFTAKDELVWTLTTNGKTEKAYASLREDYKVDDVVKASETGALGAGSSSPEVRANKMPAVKIEGAKTRTVKVGETIDLVAVVTDDGIPKRRGFGGSAAVRPESREGAAGRGAAPAAAPPAAGAPAAAGAPTRDEGFARLLNRAANAPPVRITVGKNVGLHLSWFVYRGAGSVRFDPFQVKPWEDTRAGANSPWAPIWAPPPMPADGRIVTKATFSEPGTYVLRALADDGALTGGDNVTITVTK